VKVSVVRLVVAMLVAPLILAGVLTAAAFMIAGMSEPSQDAVMAVTHESGIAMLTLSYAFTLIFGVAGVAGLWFLDQRGPVVWAFAGALLGAVAGLIFGAAFMGGVERALLLGFGLGGWAIFILIRWIAGIRLTPVGAES
jgi:hypothetical protein